MMGKKKAVKKTKELSVAIAEASTVGGDETQQQQQQQVLTPRKRGRPRKIIDQKSEISEEKQEENPEEEAQEEIESKKAKISEQLLEDQEKVEATSVSKKEGGQSDDQDRELSLSKEQPFSRRGRARRKGKPRKSS